MTAAGAALLAALLPAAAAASALTEQEAAGRRIYREGTGSSAITATVGAAVLPGASLRCASCHGEDGRGRPEGVVLPPDITAAELAKPWGHAHPAGRAHPAFDDRSLARAITQGVDPAGNRLDPAMPRYSMTRADLAALLAYLKRLGTGTDPGIDAARLRIGTVLPAAGRLAAEATAMRAVLEARFDEINRAGGVHGRALELVHAGYDADRGTGVAEARALLERDVLALVSGWTPGTEEELAVLVERAGVPAVGPRTAFAREPDVPARFLFHTEVGAEDLARVLVDQLAGPARVRVVQPAGPGPDAAARAVAEALRTRGGAADVHRYVPGKLDPAAALGGAEVVVFLGGEPELEVLLRSAGSARPRLLVPGPLAGSAPAAAPPSLDGRILLAFPSLPSPSPTAAEAALSRLAATAPAVRRHPDASASAARAAAVLVEGLRRAGRHPSREGLVAALESLRGFETGLGPPLSYGPGRRVGARGGWVVSVDLGARRLRRASGWVPAVR